MKKTDELRSKFDAIFDKNLTEVDNWNSAVFYNDKQKFINKTLEAINYTPCCMGEAEQLFCSCGSRKVKTTGGSQCTNNRCSL